MYPFKMAIARHAHNDHDGFAKPVSQQHELFCASRLSFCVDSMSGKYPHYSCWMLLIFWARWRFEGWKRYTLRSGLSRYNMVQLTTQAFQDQIQMLSDQWYQMSYDLFRPTVREMKPAETQRSERSVTSVGEDFSPPRVPLIATVRLHSIMQQLRDMRKTLDTAQATGKIQQSNDSLNAAPLCHTHSGRM